MCIGRISDHHILFISHCSSSLCIQVAGQNMNNIHGFIHATPGLLSQLVIRHVAAVTDVSNSAPVLL